MGSAIDLNEIIAAQHDLEEKLSHLNDESLETKRRLFTEHIQKISAKKAYIFPEFEKGKVWCHYYNFMSFPH